MPGDRDRTKDPPTASPADGGGDRQGHCHRQHGNGRTGLSPDSWPGWDPEWPALRRDDSPWAAAEQAIAENRWNWRHIADLRHPDYIEGHREELARRARDIRAERDTGQAFTIETAEDAAAAILSFAPDETLPVLGNGDVSLWHRIDEETHVLPGAKPGTPAFGIGAKGAALKLVLGTPQGLELRRRIWGTDSRVGHVEETDAEE